MAARDYEQEVRMNLTELVIEKTGIALEAKEQADDIIRLVEKLSKFVVGGDSSPDTPKSLGLTASEIENTND